MHRTRGASGGARAKRGELEGEAVAVGGAGDVRDDLDVARRRSFQVVHVGACNATRMLSHNLVQTTNQRPASPAFDSTLTRSDDECESTSS